MYSITHHLTTGNHLNCQRIRPTYDSNVDAIFDWKVKKCHVILNILIFPSYPPLGIELFQDQNVDHAMDSRSIKCFNCGKEGHIKRECPDFKSKVNNRASIKCFSCGKHGHIAKKCPGNNANGGNPSTSPATKSENSSFSKPVLPASTVKFIDSHCHMDYVFERYRHRESFKKFQSKYGFPDTFDSCITTFCDPASFSSLGNCKELLQDDQIWGTFGFHPHTAKYYNVQFEDKLIEHLAHPKAVALGEIGLDYSVRSQSDPEVQMQVFTRQVRLAESLAKPLVIHCREAENDVFDVLSSILPKTWKIHLHCYTGSYDLATKFFNHFPNLYLGITGIVTFSKASQVHEVVYDVPVERLVLETDAPYLVPSNLGKTMKWSHPGMIPLIAEEVAKIKKIDMDIVLENSLKNIKDMYGI